MEKQFYEVRNKYLAEGLAFLGFKYYKFDKENGQKIYSFKDTEQLRASVNQLLSIKKELNLN